MFCFITAGVTELLKIGSIYHYNIANDDSVVVFKRRRIPDQMNTSGSNCSDIQILWRSTGNCSKIVEDVCTMQEILSRAFNVNLPSS